MKSAIAGLACLLAVAGWTSIADAYLVDVTTSVEVGEAAGQAELGTALETAVAKVLHDAIAFEPTLVVLTHVQIVGRRLWVRLLIADDEGRAIYDALQDYDALEEREEAPPAHAPLTSTRI